MKIDYDEEVQRIDGEQATLAEHRGKVLLIVNTASKCGFTGQFDGLESLHRDFSTFGFSVLGFPCNQFGNQDPDSDDEIATFCRVNYGVTFPMHAKVNVNGADAHPLFKTLKSAAPGALNSKSIKWNFTKFLVAHDGTVLARFRPNMAPKELRAEIEAALADRDRRAAS